MADIITPLFEEIRRLARKEIKEAFSPMEQRTLVSNRRVAKLREEVEELKKELAKFGKKLGVEEIIKLTYTEEEILKTRITPKYIRLVREKFGVDRQDMSLVLEVNRNSIYLWETGRSFPRWQMQGKIMHVRDMKRSEFKALLARIKEKN